MPPVEYMKTSIEHLPALKRAELERVQAILFEEFDDALKLATSKHKKASRILKVVLFGSYARGDWVDEAAKTTKGYQSDFDILVVVNYPELTDVATYWYAAEDRIIRDVKTPVGLIFHTMEEVNDKLHEGQYFFTDIIKDGIALYELPGHNFSEPGPQTPQDAYERAQEHFGLWLETGLNSIRMFDLAFREGLDRESAFNLHQAIERLCTCYILVTTFYSPPTHNIKRLRSMIEGRDARFRGVWTDEDRFQRRAFERLKEAYVKGRYSKHYTIDRDELVWLGERAAVLRDLVKAACEERLAELRAEAEAPKS